MDFSKHLILVLIIGCVISNKAQAQTKKISSIEVFVFSLQASTPYPIGLKELSDSSRFVVEITDKTFLENIENYTNILVGKKPKKTSFYDYRILLAINYSDGRAGYIVKNRLPLIMFNNNIYKDKNHLVYRMLNRYKDKIKTIELFLYEHDKYVNEFPID